MLDSSRQELVLFQYNIIHVSLPTEYTATSRLCSLTSAVNYMPSLSSDGFIMF